MALGAAGTGRGRPGPVDYLSAGPVVPTPTKPGRPGTGTGYLSEAVRPIALAGVGHRRGRPRTAWADLVAAGARHFVVVRWLVGRGRPRAAARPLRRRIDRARRPTPADGDRVRRGPGRVSRTGPGPGRRSPAVRISPGWAATVVVL